MSGLTSRKDLHSRCDACDHQRLKELEDDPRVRSLRDKIEQLSFRLAESRTENHLLRRNLQLAKKMVFQEVGAEVEDFQQLMKKGTEEGWKGRQESVLVLKKRVQELRRHLKELEGGDKQGDGAQEGGAPPDLRLPGEKKRLWRMELERRLARESAEKDLDPLVRQCHELRRKLDGERGRFRGLTDEVKLLRAELQTQVAKIEEESGLVSSYRTMEKQLQETLAERANVRMELDSFRNRNNKMVEELDYLKKELEVLQNKSKENDNLISSLTSSHKAVQESIEVEKVIVQQNVDRYKTDLETLTRNHAKDVEILDQLQTVMYTRNFVIDELKRDVAREQPDPEKSATDPENGKKSKDYKQRSPASEEPGNSAKDPEQRSSSRVPTSEGTQENQEPEQAEDQSEDQPPRARTSLQLRLECEKFKALCQAARIESTYLLNVLSRQEKLMNDIAAQVVETGQLSARKNTEKKQLLEKIGQLQQAEGRRRKGTKDIPRRTKLDEVRIKCEAQKDENDFLRNFLVGAVEGKAADLDFYRECVAEYKHFFQAALKSVEDSVKAVGPPPGQHSEEEPAED